MSLKRNILVSFIFLLLWGALITVEVKVANYSILKYLYFSTWPLIIVSFIWANKNAHIIEKNKYFNINLIQGILISIAFILINIIVGVNFKYFLGGTI
jgi:hypothetical protein